jgi:hypothetical protein
MSESSASASSVNLLLGAVKNGWTAETAVCIDGKSAAF